MKKQIIIIFLLIFINCDFFEYIKITNKTSEPIFLIVSNNNLTDLNNNKNHLNKILPYSSYSISFQVNPIKNRKKQLEKIINEDFNGNLYFYIFKEKTIKNIPWDTIIKYKKYDKIYKLSSSDLKKINYEIVYKIK